jgi:cytochrome c556
MKTSLMAAGVLLAVASGVVLAQVKPEILVKQRQAVMTLQGKYWGPIAGMASGKVSPYNADIVARNATYLENLAQMAWDGFHPSTSDVKSAALPAVFSDAAGFQRAVDRLQAETAKLGVVARARDEAGVKAQFGAVGKSCGGCHESFRVKQ